MASFLKRNLAASKRLKAKLRAGDLATLCHSSHRRRAWSSGSRSWLRRCTDRLEHGSVGRDRVEEMARAPRWPDGVDHPPEGSLPHLITGYLRLRRRRFHAAADHVAHRTRSRWSTSSSFSAPCDHADRPLILMIERIEAVEQPAGDPADSWRRRLSGGAVGSRALARRTAARRQRRRRPPRRSIARSRRSSTPARSAARASTSTICQCSPRRA